MKQEKKKTVKLFAKCECGISELTKKEIEEGQENSCVMCDKCFMPKIIKHVAVNKNLKK